MLRGMDWLDKPLTGVLLALLVCMVLSITSEIVLSAVVQPIAAGVIQRHSEDRVDDGTGVAPVASESPRLVAASEKLMGWVAKASAPLNTASQTLLVWVGILGSALAFRQRAHLGVDALVRLYPRRVRVVLDYLATTLVGLFSAAVLLVGGFLVVRQAFKFGSKMPGIESLNRGWFYLVLPITGVLTLIYCLYHFARPVAVGSDDGEQLAK